MTSFGAPRSWVWSRLSPALLAMLAAACTVAAPPRTTNPGPPTAEISELWVDPTDLATRDLYWGPGGPAGAPDANAAYRLIAGDHTGTSRGYDVRDPNGVDWDIKIGAEAQPEVVVSRLFWAAGYHQLADYYLREWRMVGGMQPGKQPPGRFRAESAALTDSRNWSWHENPFADTVPFRGLIVLNLLVNNWDLKTSNNAVVEMPTQSGRVRRMYTVVDLGDALGRNPGWITDGMPNHLAGFEREGFIKGLEGGRVLFDYRRPYPELLSVITPRDVHWACARLARLSDRQWHDAFRAGGYRLDEADRYIAKLRARIAEGTRLTS